MLLFSANTIKQLLSSYLKLLFQCDSGNDPQNRSKKGENKFILKGARTPIPETMKNQLVFLGYGKILIPRKDLFCEKPVENGIAVKMTRPVFDNPPFSSEFLENISNEAMLQNYGSIQICETLLEVLDSRQPDSKIFDMCAAPGGKTAYLLSKLPDWKWYAGDKPSRAHLIKKNIMKIHNYENVNLIIGDSADTKLESSSFSAILLDAPCSATGSRPKGM